MKSALLATKSVSQFSSSSDVPECATRPLAAVRPARLPTSLAPLIRRISTALSKSPSASSSAFLQSIIPAPVRSRSFLTSAAVKFDIVSLTSALWLTCRSSWLGRASAASRPRPACCRRAARAPTRAAARRAATVPGSGFASAPPARRALPERAIRPAATASATTRVSSAAERIASSLPGIGKSTSSGSQLVSSTAITGMPSLRASSTAMCSFLVSTIQTAAGTRCMSRRPPRVLVSLIFSRCSWRVSFLV